MILPNLESIRTDDPVARKYMEQVIGEYVSARTRQLTDELPSDKHLNMWVTHTSDYFDIKLMLTRDKPGPDDKQIMQKFETLAQTIERELYERHIVAAVFVSLTTE